MRHVLFIALASENGDMSCIGVARVLRLGGQMSSYVNLPPVKN